MLKKNLWIDHQSIESNYPVFIKTIKMSLRNTWSVLECLKFYWTARRSNQSILKEISPGCSLEGLMLKLKHQYFGYLMQITDSFEKTLMLGKIEGRRRREQQRMRWLVASPTQRRWVWVNSWSWWWTGRPGLLQFMRSQRIRHNWATGLNWMNAQSPLQCHCLNYKVCLIVLGAQWVHNTFM